MLNQLLLDQFYQFSSIPFPPNSDDKVISDVHDQLVEYDGYMAGLISSYAKGNQTVKSKICYDDQFEKSIAQRVVESPHLEKEAQVYFEYLQKLKELIDLAQQS